MQFSSICLPVKVPVRVMSLQTNPATVNDTASSAKVAAPKWAQKTITLPPLKRGCHLITSKILKEVQQELNGFECGLAHLFLHHTSASLTINENYDYDVRDDTETFLNRIVPEGPSAPWKHTIEGPDDMPAHIKSSMFGCTLMIPISNGKLNMGTWQKEEKKNKEKKKGVFSVFALHENRFPCFFALITMKYIRSNSLKRLFSFGRRGFGEENEVRLVVSPCEEHPPRPSWKCFTYEELFDATNGFSSENLIGKGGYAEVYKGVLNGGEEVAVKRLTRTSRDERKEKEFLIEIGTIGHVHHSNVLPLLGCCIDNGLYLVFELSTVGSVASVIHDENLPPLDWKTRYKIALGSARGLHYLHKGCKRRIIHRDIKASNILLTADFEPKISDFGLARWLPSQWTHHSIAPIEGTFGHLAPEYYMHGVVDEKTDVFAFGVFLLELISGRKPVDGSYQSLHSWAKPIVNKGEIEKLVDPRLGGDYDVTQFNRIAFAASLCIRASATCRPTMSEVLEVMEEWEMDKEKWEIAEEEEQEVELWSFEDLEFEREYDSTFSMSLTDSVKYIG